MLLAAHVRECFSNIDFFIKVSPATELKHGTQDQGRDLLGSVPDQQHTDPTVPMGCDGH